MATIAQQSAGRGNISMPSPITAGRTLIVLAATRGVPIGGAGWTPSAYGYTAALAEGTYAGGGGNAVGIFYKTAGAAEPQTIGSGASNPGGGQVSAWFELPGIWTPATSATGQGTGQTMTAGPIVAASGGITVAIAAIGQGGAWDSGASTITITPGAGWTEDVDYWTSSGSPNVWGGHRFDAGSITGQATEVDGGGLSAADYRWVMQVASFMPPAAPGFWIDFDRD